MTTPVSAVTTVSHDAPPVQVHAKPPQKQPHSTDNDTVEISSAAKSAAQDRTGPQTNTARDAAKPSNKP